MSPQNAGTLVSWAGEWNPGSGFRNEHDGFCFGAARYSLHGQRAFPWRQGDAAGRVFGKFGPAARSRKGEFLQVAVYGITYLEKGGGRRGYGVIRRYRVRASLFRLNVPADGTEVRQNIEFSEVLGLCVGNEAVLRSEDAPPEKCLSESGGCSGHRCRPFLFS